MNRVALAFFLSLLPAAAMLHADKAGLTALYQTTLKSLVAAHGGQPFTPAVKDNELALRVGKVATERLITTIVAAVKEEQKSTSAYAPQRLPATRRGFMTAAALDRRL